ncbi:hypothetical protein MUN81_03735 [Hymenobacter sp. 5317J-9]|uniref:hypothetical protein n=1 Tax=Hymenobacter sp. 5317J-9 TaxID=2932250 RepID=UPI001FD71551|nr:hypothetical protein [Hymenobacter sp. 5317J-9]UOQ98607.1 hypothetical protein MUN81_03735 [Hymenobacter sp. 5317J-9]
MLISWRPAAQAQLYLAPDCSQPQTYTATLGSPTQTQLQPTGQGLWRADVKVRGVPAGQYAARLLVDGVPVSMQKVVVNR